MEVMSARDAAEKKDISQRRGAILCSENHVLNSIMVGNIWVIPSDAEKPTDARSVRYITTDKTVKPFIK